MVVGIFPITNINMGDWHTFKMVWSSTNPADTVQKVAFYLDGQLVGQTHPFPAMPALSTEIWNDNQVFSFSTGTATFENPAATQTFDLDYVNISQP
jgi:hypothetical protein